MSTQAARPGRRRPTNAAHLAALPRRHTPDLSVRESTAIRRPATETSAGLELSRRVQPSRSAVMVPKKDGVRVAAGFSGVTAGNLHEGGTDAQPAAVAKANATKGARRFTMLLDEA